MKDPLETVLNDEDDKKINLGEERAAEIYAHIIGTGKAKFGAHDTPEGVRRLAEAAVKKIFQNGKIPPEIKALLDKKFPTNEYPQQKGSADTERN